MSRHFYIGTSGWNYKHWINRFYPHELKQKDWLQFYIDKGFYTVELNNPFYRLPEKKTFEKWSNQVPEHFRYSIKANRYITHLKKLHETGETLDLFINNTKGLAEKAGPVLFQLPPGFKFSEERLAAFLELLPNDFRYTFEFRNKTWWNETTLKLLSEYKCAFCIYELAGVITPREVTTDFIYIRLHGPDGKYAGKYTDEVLADWADTFLKWEKQHKTVYCYFDNDQNAYAVENAYTLNKMVKAF
jgi:uncharacterized protein YecE (DUF72 family)